MMKVVRLFLLALLLSAIGFGFFLFRGSFGLKAALSVNSDPQGKPVYLDGREVGTTPFYADNLTEGEFTLKVDEFSRKVHLTNGALTVVNWSFGPSEGFSGGEIVWFTPSSMGTELLVITKPEAEVFLEGKSLGNTPLSKEIQAGTYSLEIKKDGYFPRSLKIAAKEGYRLNVSAELSLDPFPSGEVNELDIGGPHIKVFDLSTDQPALLANFSFWAAGATFYAKTDESRNYNYFLTAEGKLYDRDGSEVSLSSLTQQEEDIVVGYLGEMGKGVTESAAAVFDQLQAVLFPAPPQVLILETGTGFLRVRSGPGKNYSEVGRVAPGEQYEYLGEGSGWFKIKFKGGEGWVSGEFAKKL